MNNLKSYNHYIYDGPILDKFDKIINPNWHGETMAVSKEKAISNLKYQYKDHMNLNKAYSIKLDTFYLSVVEKKPYFKQEIIKIEEDVECQLTAQLKLF